MNGPEFASKALATEKPLKRLNFSLAGTAMLLNAAALMANLLDQAKKTLIYDKPFDDALFRDNIEAIIDQLQTLKFRSGSIAVPEDVPVPLHQPNLRLLHGGIGMFGEAGEILEALLKSIQTGELDTVNLVIETGDSDWYKNLIHDETGVPEEEARARVIAKLTDKIRGRYKDGYSDAAALNRDVAAERVLEEGATMAAAANADQAKEAA